MRLAEQLSRLTTLSSAELRDEWRRVLKEPAPPLSADLLTRGIAYRLQERVHGAMTGATRRRIERLVGQLDRRGEVAAERAPVLKVGTRLVRDWQGRSHHVLVLDDGFLFEDRRYASLTAVAATITGAKWSGPRFFGLKRRPKAFEQVNG